MISSHVFSCLATTKGGWRYFLNAQDPNLQGWRGQNEDSLNTEQSHLLIWPSGMQSRQQPNSEKVDTSKKGNKTLTPDSAAQTSRQTKVFIPLFLHRLNPSRYRASIRLENKGRRPGSSISSAKSSRLTRGCN